MSERRVLATLVLALGLAGFCYGASDDPDSPEATKDTVLKDCRTFGAYSEAKMDRIKLALARGQDKQAEELAAKLKAEEARALERIIWYLHFDRRLRARVDYLKGQLEKITSATPEEFLKVRIAHNYAVPTCLCNPYAVDVDAPPPARPSPSTGASPAGHRHKGGGGGHGASAGSSTGPEASASPGASPNP